MVIVDGTKFTIGHCLSGTRRVVCFDERATGKMITDHFGNERPSDKFVSLPSDDKIKKMPINVVNPSM